MLHPPCVVILIGASTGGTRVLPTIVRLLPALPACIVIVQHMPKFINESFARTLAQNSTMPVRLAQNGDSLSEGLILVAPSGLHCRLLQNTRVTLSVGDAINYVCPAVDALMESCIPSRRQRIIGVLLTGMGKDGAAGMLHIRRLGGLTIAQNEASCAVYGMPAEAAKLGAVDRELSPAEIARVLIWETLNGANQLTSPPTRGKAIAGALNAGAVPASSSPIRRERQI